MSGERLDEEEQNEEEGVDDWRRVGETPLGRNRAKPGTRLK